ncbi:hypothetical protein B0H16DRAFT_1747393 [Mycena metata]|uniref:Uncharacterized protein n=1 Tax=Mycena metata TaxID=1033252 RepID=A0AAD7GTU0_9AGAR|nr:hypothetical protein B0H16DRAFT_1747393 [Mycena metata]
MPQAPSEGGRSGGMARHQNSALTRPAAPSQRIESDGGQRGMALVWSVPMRKAASAQRGREERRERRDGPPSKHPVVLFHEGDMSYDEQVDIARTVALSLEPDPKAWLIYGLTEDEVRWLLNIGMVGHDNGLTIFTHRFSPEISGFVTTFEGFIIPADDPDLTRAIIGNAIAGDHDISSHVRGHCDRFTPDWSADEAFARFCESISVASIELLTPNGGDPYTAWNVYVEPFTNDKAHFATFVKLVKTLVITTTFEGQGRARPYPFHCAICPGTDHPTNLCPCPLAPGYHGPTPETIGALLKASHDAISTKDSNKPKYKKGRKEKGDRKGKGAVHNAHNGGDRRAT